MLEKIEGIVIKTIDYGETHKIITIFSKKLGKFSAIAKGAKKPKSRMAAVTQPFILGQFLVYVNSGLSSIQQGEIMESFRSIREDIIKTAYTAYITEFTEKLVDEKSPDGYLYDQLYQTIRWISENEDMDIPIMMFELKLFEKGGFAPTLIACVNCGQTEPLSGFSILEGGVLCNGCLHKDADAIPLTPSLIRLLQVFSRVGLEQVGKISVKPENRRLLRQLLDSYYDRYGGYYLKSKRFLNQLDRLN
ncbi:DNA replication and repair protein RecO [Oceanobacillus limi]|uniref:DNA repair protein RecO n=1 Tax=Oceanobacillus limi TaxID=930131 RepID=A0A1I0FS60_9BACI|nr:DNA repair protein RecO [Oceanobacillus limi]SET61217.1 DNA replication and repair protein RecO [Oceanobacillus limi]